MLLVPVVKFVFTCTMLFSLLFLFVLADAAEIRRDNDIVKRANVCYGALGCFSTDGAFGVSAQRPLTVVPESPDKIKTMFKLYTREHKTTPQDLDARRLDSLATVWTNFKSVPVKFIVHGFIDDTDVSPWLRDMKDEFLKAGDFNVVIVDWSGGNLLPYTQATANTRVVGAQIAAVIKKLIEVKGRHAADFHIIGHSLGSHIAGYAGERVPGLGRISGLDPAGPYFENTDKTVRLDPSDAAFVDVIHSDATSLIQLGLGIKQTVGHLDFYPNLGHDQPGCTRNPFTQIADWGVIQGAMEVVCCNHLRAIKFFTESINSQCPYMGTPCNNEDDYKNGKCTTCGSTGCAAMGYHSDRNKPPSGQTRKFFTTTSDKRPFCQYHLNIAVKLNPTTGAEERGELYAIVTGDKSTTPKVLLNSSPISFQVGKVYHFTLGSSVDVGNVRSITLFWNHIGPLLNPLQWNILGLRNPKLFIDEVDVQRLEANVDLHLCSAGQSVETDHSIVLSTRC
ncbi:pancreatic triacylglycerol lipase-like [Physella acuta]|uniref:pancreatic triacylglycerol lipase-like n=1 Tax=Physella acuta TaxID=109671 RepID=UPI0027DC7DBC|nr:pancreatic triacylglycerol lipase-like [Physella acuta]